jgi:4-amino-4-deoxy-L-arabinose transferase-like glycosyltransferase
MVNKKNLITAMTIGFGTIILHYIYRPLLPIDETRYASVAWEMWLNHDWLVPYMNGLPYSHKPPLLFWIINITWNISGVSEWGVRLIIPMIALSNFYLTYQLAKLIYKNNFEAVNYSPLILVNIMGWYLYIPFLYFDQLLTVFILANIYFSWCYAETNKKTYYIFAGISMGLAMLTKGPVTLVYLLPVFISYPCWRKSNMICCSDWFKGCIANFSIGTGIILCWAVPAAINGGPDYAKEIFIWQSFNRINKSFSHAKPFYYYTLLLPVLLSPTCFSFALWRVKKWLPLSKEDKFFFYNIPSTFLLLSCISGKQIHYLLPLFPLLSIYLASKLKLEHFKIEPILISLLLLLALTCFTSSYWQSFFFPHIKLTRCSTFRAS